MLSLIPARLYFPKDAAADEEFAMRKKGFLKVSTEKSSKLAKKEARSQALKDKVAPSLRFSPLIAYSSILRTSRRSLKFNVKQRRLAQQM